jgi:hypothetical protein|nr:MAG TPA: minor structural protein [Caudoviricetes sp.]DAF28275.1 MAG TPA: minor structural protein [Caudoviricetes sp.]
MDFTSIFNGEALTLAQFNEKTKGMKLADLSTGEYVAKGKDKEQKEEIEFLKRQLAEKDETISNLEKAKGDSAAVQAELEKYKQAEAERAKQEKEAQMDAILTQTAESALEGREFVNEYTRAHFLGELKKAIQDPANKGKKPADLFADMTKDVDGIFRNPQHEPLKIAGVTKSDTSGNMTKDQIMSIKDASERQAAIAEHLDLFRKD